MKKLFGFLVALGVLAPVALADEPDHADTNGSLFSAPIRLKGGDEYIATESPGYASPCWHDMDGDGKKDLIVGQFSGGKMKVYRNLGDGRLDEGRWLEVNGKPAEVPGVW